MHPPRINNYHKLNIIRYLSYIIENASRKAGVEFAVEKQMAVVWHD